MAEIILDLTGQAGLADNFFGDTDVITPAPELRVNVKEGQMAAGLYNPYLRQNYLAPITTTASTYTLDEVSSQIITAIEYDSVNDDVFFAEYGQKIYKGDGLSDSSLVEVLELQANSTIQDIEIYTKYLQRHLFYLYGTNKQTKTNSLSYRSMWDKFAIRVDPVGTVRPQVIANDYLYYTSPTTLTRTITVPTADNIACVVAIRTLDTVSSVTVDGVAMSIGETKTRLDGTTMWTTYIYSLTGITAGDVDVEIVKSGTSTTYLHVLFTDNTSATPVGLIEHTYGVSDEAASSIDVIDNSLLLNLIIADKSNHNLAGAGTTIFYNPSTQTGGNGGTMYIDDTGTKMYVDGIPSGGVYKIFQYTLGTAWDVTTATYASKSLEYTSQIDGILSRIKFNTDGTILAIANYVSTNTKVCIYSLSTPWDISTATHLSARDFTLVLDSGTEWYGFDISSNGEHMYLPITEGSGKQLIRHYTLGTAWDPSTAVLSEDSEYSGDNIETIHLAANDTVLVIREVNANTFTSYNFDPLFPYDANHLSEAVGDDGEPDEITPTDTMFDLYFPNRGTYFYGRRSNDDVYRFTMIQGTLSVISTSSRTIHGSLETFQHEIVTEEDNSKVVECGVAQLPFGTITDNTWLSNKTGTNITSTSNYNFLRKADNGFAYIFAGNAVHKIDGELTGGLNGTVTRNVLLLPSYFTITDAIDYRSGFYIAIHQYPVDIRTVKTQLHTGACGILVWDRLSTQLGGTEYIEIPGVREIKKIYASPDGVLKLICISDNGLTELRQFGYNDSGGVVFPVQKKLGIGAFPNVPNGLTVAGDKAIWLANDGTLYCEKDNAVTKLFEVKIPGNTTDTVIENINSGAILYGSESEIASDGFRSNKQAVLYSFKHMNELGEIIYTDSGIRNAVTTLNNTQFACANAFVVPGNGTAPIASVQAFMKKYSGSPTGPVTARIYNYTGTLGSGSPATDLGSPIATSDPIEASTFPADYENIVFTFSGAQAIDIVGGQTYVFAIVYTNGGITNKIAVGQVSSGLSGTEEFQYFSSAWNGGQITSRYLMEVKIVEQVESIEPLLKKIYPFDLTDGSNTAQTLHQGDVYTGVQYIPITSVLRKVRIYNAPITGTGTDVIATVKLYFNQSSTAGVTKSISKDEAKRGYVDFSINKPYIHAVQIEIEWATGTTLGADMYLPSVAIISHDPTDTSSPDNG